MGTTIMQSLTFIIIIVSEKITPLKSCYIYSVQENHNAKLFAAYGQSAGPPDTDHYMDSHFSSESKKNRKTEEKKTADRREA